MVRQLMGADKKLLILRINQKRNGKILRNEAGMSMKTKDRYQELGSEAGMSMKTHIVSF